MSVADAQAAWRDWLKSERRLADHTLIAYEHDVATFLGFMATYLGETPTLAALARLKPAEFRAWLAERWRDEQQRPRAEEDEPGGAGRAATTEVRG